MEEECGIEELYQGVPQILPQTMQLSWQHLVKQHYGAAMWDIVAIDGDRTVLFMARESKAFLQRLPKRVDAYWKAISMGMEVKDRRVMPVVVLIDVLALGTIYEVWFNFYGEAQKAVQEAITLLGEQEYLMLAFYDKGPEPVRMITFANELATFFHGHYGLLKSVPEWSDKDFDKAKQQMMDQYSPEQLWRLI